ncbi:hypothetical protein [Tahibacter amnicola]|uniref:Uncharacterized protein n=1 Tax=Tahibacter amnicola TaxID=2976241 RepID=A0ABY6BAI8_9GAMM|nr:hypothetical protein [Tahibacter amnicola]UXI66812.1 hypothetical protein N4264_18940 [Tahibacter amnicola]
MTGVPVNAFEVRPGITGNWYDPAQNGHGFQLEVLPGGIVTAFWFTFDNAGNQVWISAAGPITQNRVVMNVNRALNGRFPPNFNPANVTVSAWGTLTFTFTDCDHGSVSWASTDPAFTASGTMTLERLTRIDGLACD